MDGQQRIETLLPVFACGEACEIQSKGTQALRSNQRFHNMVAVPESPIPYVKEIAREAGYSV